MSEKEIEYEYYESLNELWLYNWSQFVITNDNNWLIKGYDGRQSKVKNNYLDELAVRLQDEHFDITQNTKSQRDLSNWEKINNLIARHTRVCVILDRLLVGFSPEEYETRLKYIQLLAKDGLRIPEVNTYEGDSDEVAKCYDVLGQIRNQIALLEIELKPADEKKVKNTSLSKQLKQVAIGLELGFALDAKKITVIDWIDYCSMLEEKSDSLSGIV